MQMKRPITLLLVGTNRERWNRCPVLGCILVALATMASTPPIACAQEEVQIEGPAACGDCELSVRPVTVIYDEYGEAGLAGHPLAASRARDGRIYLASSQFEPMWFEPSGAFGGILGRPGEGPGEYAAVRWIAVAGDHVITYDISLSRRTTWTLDGEYVSSRPLPPTPFATPVEFADGSIIIGQALDWPSTAGLPYHRFDERGEWLESFGREVTVRDAEDRRRLTRLLAPAGGESFWASPLRNYTLEHYTKEGEVLARVSRAPAWFPEPSRPTRVTPEVPPTPNIRSISVDEEGRVWVLVTVGNPDWHRGFAELEEPGPDGEPTPTIVDYHQVFDSIVEVIDPESGTLLASERFDLYLMKFLDGRHLAGYDVDDFGIPIIEVFEVALSRPEQTP